MLPTFSDTVNKVYGSQQLKKINKTLKKETQPKTTLIQKWAYTLQLQLFKDLYLIWYIFPEDMNTDFLELKMEKTELFLPVKKLEQSNVCKRRSWLR